MTEQLSSLALRNFTATCRSPATRYVYTKALQYFMEYLRLERDAYDKLLDKDPKLIQMDICDFVTHLRKEGIASGSISLYLAALSKFYSMNDITTLNWKKIHSFEGEREKVADDRPYTHNEIQMLLGRSGIRNRAIIQIMTSAGLRVGAVPLLRLKDLESIDKYGIYKINVYTRSKKSRYFTFCTPECRKEIDEYLASRRRNGRSNGAQPRLGN